jgi:hypothetical protein
MAINNTIARASGFMPEIWGNIALDVLRANITLARLASKDTDFTPSKVGEALTIGYPGTFKAQRTNGNATPQDPAGGSKVRVEIKEARSVDFIIDDIARAQSQTELMERYVNSAVMAIAEQIESDLFSLYTGYPASVGSFGTALTATTIRAAGRRLTDNRIPRAGRAIVMATADEEALKNDSNLSNYFANSRPEAVSQGAIGMLDGFMLYPSQLTPRGARFAIDATGGTFTITIPSLDSKDVIVPVTSGNITYSASLTAASIQTTLAALTGVGTGNISVTGANGGPYTVRPIGALAGSNLDVTATNVALTGGAATITTTPCNIGLAVGPEAMILVMRPYLPIETGNGTTAMDMVDVESGLTIRVLHTYDITARGHRIGFDCLYGFSRLRNGAAVVLNT